MAEADWLPGSPTAVEEGWLPTGARWWEGGAGYRSYDGYRVAGGVGGIAFEWQELASAATGLEAAASTIGHLWQQVLGVQLLLADPSWALLPERMAAEAAVQAAVGSLAELADACGGLAAKVRLARGTYLAAEQAAASGMQAVDAATWWFTVPAGMAANEGRPTLAGGERLLNQGPAVLAGALGGPAAGVLLWDGRHGGRGNQPVSRHLAVLLGAAGRRAGLLHGSRIEVERGDSVVEEIEPSPASLSGLLERTAIAAEAGDGTMEVLEVESGGQKRWVVALPGTQAAGTAQPTANPFDESGVAEAVAAGSPFVADAVSRALREAGADADDLVVLTSYSQGGIHAMNLAADPAFLAEHNVGFVLTAGSPVAGIVAGPGVRSVHLEHVQDWVPGADAGPNPNRREQVTVTLTDPVATPAGAGVGLGPGHDLQNYVQGARAMDASADPSVQDAAAYLGAALAGGAARQHLFTLRRSQPDGGRPPRTGSPAGRTAQQRAGAGGCGTARP
ncbi:hypothetical protein [Arthrobacter sulfonylureivorans]|uniref:PE-PPE domain-containing protein n=1 Tax=Arthrobacter sulfonylureivorans TaxID=2486855 RepID=A0ABY3WC58_9MICC|nr:hypothetical protein [Arthrobacter sulfonylureivorans]UNK46148.1 hypothetical protein MNQ99_01895 [Arthrobacter sulfonylureivorans]